MAENQPQTGEPSRPTPVAAAMDFLVRAVMAAAPMSAGTGSMHVIGLERREDGILILDLMNGDGFRVTVEPYDRT